MFQKQTELDWIVAIQQAIKEKAVQDFAHEIYPDLKYDPFAYSESDFGQIVTGSHKIGVNLETNFDNKTILNALENGAQALSFKLNSAINQSAIESALKDVHLDYIIPIFEFENEVSNDLLKAYLKEIPANHNISQIITSAPIDHPHETILLKAIAGDTLNSIAMQLSRISNSPNYSYCIETYLGNKFYFEIAKLRAIRIVASNLWDTAKNPLHVLAKIDESIIDTEVHQGLIAQSVCAMSSVLGGANFTILKSWIKPNDLNRLSLNILNIQSLESHLDIANDPLYGSYFIEDLTQKIAQLIWNKIEK